MDSHVRPFGLAKGAWRGPVHNDMESVANRLIGKDGRGLDRGLLMMGIYHGLSMNVTDRLSPNERGPVGSAARSIRDKASAPRRGLGGLEDARSWLGESPAPLNADSAIEGEESCLMPHRPPLGIARATEALVDEHSLVRVGGNPHPVPEHLVGERPVAKACPGGVIVYAGQSEAARHRRLAGLHGRPVGASPCLGTLTRRPGAAKGPAALKGQARPKAIFDGHHASRPKGLVVSPRDL